ncbi:MAG: four helix bundle protein [Bacteroidetes bacterium]|nr:MAG: four helix bundle protein [Bacteroidota bacterium]
MASCLSVPSNIAEGSERMSDKEFIRFLNISLGSLVELKTQLSVLQRLKSGAKLPIENWLGKSEELYVQIHAFKAKLRMSNAK